ncbi:lipoprotein [Mycoplasmopsis californica]|uniref:Lipoprotein n=2 Tax=Mycoplasmopsis californica TaxID=2113 RepID=A0A059XRV6_9BACT|nr:lipoprotein [Mycoplasmopsis californica]
MMKIKKILQFALISQSLLPILSISCQQSKMLENTEKTTGNIENKHKDKWNLFLQYEYVNSLLNLVYGNHLAEKNKFIKQQIAIPNKYLTDVKEYLFYANNITAFSRSEDNGSKKVIPLQEFGPKLEQLFTQNWLWFLFNLDRFTFAYYDTFDQFKADLETLSLDIQKSSLELGSFNRPRTNEVLKHVIYESHNTENKEFHVYLLTKQGIILEISITAPLTDTKSKIPQVSVYTYSYIYPSLFQNAEELEKFDLSKYVATLETYRNFPKRRTDKILFDDKYGGEPLRFTIVDIDNKTTK